jgi:predicted membrane-bound spermidine synthase
MTTSASELEQQTPAERIGAHHYLGIFLLSLATLLLELSLTRVLSVALWYHFGFLVISTALLGFGTSGVVLALWRRLREEISLDHALAMLALLFGVLTVVCFWLMQRIPFDPFSLFSDKRQLAFMPLYYIVISLPFFCSGLALALLFTRGGTCVNRLYAFDLVGAGVGCAALALIMPLFGGSGSAVFAGALGLLAAAIFGFRSARRIAAVGVALAAGFFALAFFAGRVLPISITPNKPIPPQPPIYTAWNTFSKIDVYEAKALPRSTTGRGARRFIFDAGTAATGMVDLRPNVREVLKQLEGSDNFSSNIAYVGKTRPRVLIIGSGGGNQVLDALHYGAEKIIAVEINPIINDVINNRMRDYWGDLYQQPEVEVVTEEGRSFVRRSKEQYDAIISVHTISNAAIASGALSLAENYVLTREAFEDYMDHLKPDGVLYFTRPEAQISRLFSTGREALAARGVTDLPSHFFAYRTAPSTQQQPQPGGTNRLSFNAGFLMKKSPYTAEEIDAITRILHIGETPATPDGQKNEARYSPKEPPSDSIYYRLLTAPDLRTVYAGETAQIEPATDDRPFFNQHTRWSSINRKTFQDIFTQNRGARMALEDRPVAEVTLLVLLVQSIIVAAVLILLPLARFSRQGLRVPHRGSFLVYFAALGLGFIMIEIALLQRFTLFLGQPVYTFAVVLAALLIFTGFGAALSDKFGASARKNLRVIVPLILLTLLLTAFLTPYIFNAALGWSLLARVFVSVLILCPLGILLGMPFPSGLRIIGEEAHALVPWAWGVNGFFTVIGTVGALILGMAFGFKAVLVVAAVCYLIALASVSRS